MDTISLLEFIKWIEKLISAQHLYYESGQLEDFIKWMEREEIVKFMCQYLKEELAKQQNQTIYEIHPN